MKAIDGHLPIDTSYTITSCDYMGDNYSTCQNCDLPINTIVTLESTDKKRYDVGTDCAEALISKGNENSFEWWKEKQKTKEANRIKRYVAKLNKAKRENKLDIKDDFAYIIGDDGIWSVRIWKSSKAYQLFSQQ